MDSFDIENKFQFKEYLGLVFSLYIRRPFFIILTTIIIILLGFVTFSFFYNNYVLDNSLKPILIYALLYYLLIFLILWWRAKSTFNSNECLKEAITYTFTQDSLNSAGDSFNSNFSWAKVYKIKRLKRWLLVYHSSATFALVKTNEHNDDQIAGLLTYLKECGFSKKIK